MHLFYGCNKIISTEAKCIFGNIFYASNYCRKPIAHQNVLMCSSVMYCHDCSEETKVKYGVK